MSTAALASASTTTTYSHDGSVSAMLVYSHDPANQVEPFKLLRLTITRDGRTYSEPYGNPACATLCWPSPRNPISLHDLDANGKIDALLSLYSGGAHCCYLSEVFSYSPTEGGYQRVLHNWGDPGFRLEKLDASKRYEFVTADDRFAYEFAAFAFSGLPLQVLRFWNGGFVNVTRSYAPLITKDAATQWKDYLENRSGATGLGFLAAWAADEYNLGEANRVASTLVSLEEANDLRGIDPATWPTGAKFVARLDAFLRKSGYGG